MHLLNRCTGINKPTTVFLLLLLAACCGNAVAQTEGSAERPNILLIIGDDMGNESLPCFGLGNPGADTPTLDQLCDSGVRFDNFWSQPVCSPTRATVLTGRYGFRTGVGRPTGDADAIGYFPEPPAKPAAAPAEQSGRGGGARRGNAPTDYGLPLNELALPMIFNANHQLGYSTAAIGKWHLADNRNGWEDHPNIVGFDHFSGLIRGFPASYFTWNKVVDGEWSGTTGYTPEDKRHDAVAWLDTQKDNPWFLWFAFTLPHNPLHLPPEDLLNSDYSSIDPQADPATDSLPYFHAMLEAMDTEIGEILDSMPAEERANTYVIFMGDNGTSNNVVTEPYRRGAAKGTVYQGGVNVPLIVAGPGVRQGVSSALVNSTDIFSTVLDMAGIDISASIPEKLSIDSTSILPYLRDPDAKSIREYVYVDNFAGNFAGVEQGNYAMRNSEFKLLRHNGNTEFYNLLKDPYEQQNLLEGTLTTGEQAQYDQLSTQISSLRSSH